MKTTDRSNTNGAGISRGRFLKSSGGFLAAATLTQYCGTFSRNEGRFSIDVSDPIEAARLSGLDTPILQILNASITAPNPHNTQAWKFRILSDTEAELYVDETRVLPETDPTLRQIHIGQGCLLAIAEIAASRISMRADIQILPVSYRADRDYGKKPVAVIRLKPSKSVLHPLYDSIVKRTTVRSAYDEGPLLQSSDLKAVYASTGPTHSELRFTEPQNLNRHLEYHMKGFVNEAENRVTADESKHWFRIGDEEIYTKRDGISLPGNGVTGFQRWMIETFFLSHDPKDYYDPAGQKMFLDRYHENLFTAKGQILMITKTNTVRDWILTGIDYTKLNLALTGHGFVMRPTSQLFQEFDSMKNLAKEYNQLVGIKPPSKIQMNALIGRGTSEFISPRRPVQDMIRSG